MLNVEQQLHKEQKEGVRVTSAVQEDLDGLHSFEKALIAQEAEKGDILGDHREEEECPVHPAATSRSATGKARSKMRHWFKFCQRIRRFWSISGLFEIRYVQT